MKINNAKNKYDLPTDSERAIIELKRIHQDVDYKKIVGDSRVLFIGEQHYNYKIREHITNHSVQLKAAGVTHYAIEARPSTNWALRKLNDGRDVDLSGIDLGPGKGPTYERAIRTLVSEGIKIFAVDLNVYKNHSAEERESHITSNIKKILDMGSDVKVAVLIGELHAHKEALIYGVPTTNERLVKDGIQTVAVNFVGGASSGPLILMDSVVKAGLNAREFMIEVASSEIVAVKYRPSADFVIYLPRKSALESARRA